MSDGIIDLGDYIRRRDGGQDAASTFSLWGADGERSRFALPLWRAIYLAQGERGGILRVGPGRTLEPFVVLDLASEPARVAFTWDDGDWLEPDRAPQIRAIPGVGLVVYLGEEEGRGWVLVVAEGMAGRSDPSGRDREDILFLAGECAGLLFFRDFSEDLDP